MTKLTREDILKLAQLARIDLSAEEIKEFEDEFSAILNYVEQLQTVDVEELMPTSQVTGLTNVMRKDQMEDYGYEPHILLQNVPKTQDSHIKVNRMIG